MERAQITSQLTRAEFSDVQSHALAEILSGVATKSDLRELRAELKEDLQAFTREVDGKMYAFQLTVHNTLNDFRREMDQRFSAVHNKMDDRFSAMDQRFSATDRKIDQLGSTFSTKLERQDRKIDQLGSTFNTQLERQSRKATISIIGYMTFLAAVLGVVIAQAG